MAYTPLEEILLDMLKQMMEFQGKLIWLVNSYQSSSDTYVVISATEAIKRLIVQSINTKINPLKGSDVKRLLGRRAPPNGLGVQIDVAYALNILDKKTHIIATHIKNLRDVFAHPELKLMLHEEPALSAFKALHVDPEFSGTYPEVFLEYASVVDKHLQKYIKLYNASSNPE